MEHLKERIRELARYNHFQIMAIRRHLHENPELSFQEFNTAKYIATTLKNKGFKVQEGIANTGLVVVIEGKNSTKKTIALRADIDALPIHEQNKVPYKSKIDGVMHACGHDVHTSSLIGVALILNELKEEFEGSVKLIFQPAEEKAPGGAIQMIREGVLENPAPVFILGQHVCPMLPVGEVGFTKGTVQASADEIYITVHGKGGHAASPHLAIDPILIASHIIVALQQVVSRNTDPLKPCVLSICQINAGEATNIIPEVVHIAGTLRTISDDWRREAQQKIIKISQNIAEAMGGRCEVVIGDGYPCTYNDPVLTERTALVAQDYMGSDKVRYMDMNMGGEDFAYYAQKIPGCFYMIGIKNEQEGITSFVHTPTFNVDEKVLEIAPGLMTWLALNELL